MSAQQKKNEEFLRGRGMKKSLIPMYPNKFSQRCIDCGTMMYASQGHMVKPEDTKKIGTVCRNCGRNWFSSDTTYNEATMRVLRDWAAHEDRQAAKEAENG